MKIRPYQHNSTVAGNALVIANGHQKFMATCAHKVAVEATLFRKTQMTKSSTTTTVSMAL